jgi:SAM-dependent methyltransferase
MSDANSNAVPNANPDSVPDANLDAEPNANPDAKPDTDSDAQPNTDRPLNPERFKYEGIYAAVKGYATYGHTNHGSKSLPYIVVSKPESLLDVGCGHNEFCASLKIVLPNIRAVGCDFACPSADVKADILNLPFADKEFDMLTAFDVLEHLAPNQVVPALDEMARVSKRFCFSISHVESITKWEGKTLHPTVKDEQWWLDRIREAGGSIGKEGRFIVGKWSCRPCAPYKRIAIVGNGPSVMLRGERGAEIDAHDEVVRFNAFKIRGFEKFTGEKTTLWSTFGRGVVPADEDQRPKRMIFTHGPQAKTTAFPVDEQFGIDRAYYNIVRARVKAASKRKGEDLIRLLPSSGLLVTLWLIEFHGCRHIDLYGLDHFAKDESKQHHYWVPNAYGKPKEHDGDVERALLQPYVDSGIIRHL